MPLHSGGLRFSNSQVAFLTSHIDWPQPSEVLVRVLKSFALSFKDVCLVAAEVAMKVIERALRGDTYQATAWR